MPLYPRAALASVALLLATIPAASTALAQQSPMLTWTAKSSMPTGRCCLALVSHPDGMLYAIGGGGEGNILPVRNTVEAYDPLRDTWTSRSAMPTSRSFPAAAVAADGQIYVVGGFTLSSYLATVEAYDPVRNAWAAKRNMPTPRAGLGFAAAPNGKLYAVGGFNGSQWLSAVDEYDPLTDTWVSKRSMGTPREHFGLTTRPGGLLYAVGGGNGPLLASAEAYDPVRDQWTAIASMPAARWAFGFTLAPTNMLYVIGGNGGGGAGSGNLASVLEYNPLSNTWTSREPMLTARQGVAAATGANGKLYAIGGAVRFPEMGTGANEEAIISGVPVGGGGGGCGFDCPPPGQTPELGSLVLFGAGAFLLAGLGLRQRRPRPRLRA